MTGADKRLRLRLAIISLLTTIAMAAVLCGGIYEMVATLLRPSSWRPREGPPEGARAIPRAGRAAAAGFRSASNQTFFECADKACLFHAAAAMCEPAHLAEHHFTVEGTLFATESFVVPTAPGCSFVEFSDYTQDYWGACKLWKTTCPIVAGAVPDLGSSSCARKVLLQVDPCEFPFGQP